ncbi:MFS transporter, partial [Enterobacter roggenkampii]
MASSVEEVSYEFGSLFAVTVLGSLLAYLYTVNIILPNGVSEIARDSLSSALEVASSSGVDGQNLRTVANLAYDNAYLIVMYVAAAVLAFGSLVTAILLR